jgi:murein L,D-transpeptidase YafK
MKKLIFFCLISINLLFANNDILNEYRKNGIKNIEKKLDTALSDTVYWKEIIKNKDTTFGYIEKYDSILVCDKTLSNLKLYKKNKDGIFKLKQEYHAYTGKNKGDKQEEGDLKTPIGIYNLVKKIEKLDSFYGPLAFVTSYPNLYDKYNNKDGHGIWIHGLPLEQQRDEYTKGCIAINNNGLKCLEKSINLNSTLLLIYENSNIKKTDKQKLEKIASWLYKWRYAWKYNDLDTYLSFYDKDFKRFDGKNFKQFKQYKKAVFAKKEKKSIIFNDINIIPYPNHNNIYQVTFYEKYKSKHYEFNGDKELLIKIDGEKIKIFSEK